MNKYKASIDISKSIDVYFDVPLFTGDTGNTIELKFFLRGEPYRMTGVAVSAKRADGQTVFDAGTVTENTIHYTIANNMHNTPGNLDVQISLTDVNGAFLTSGTLHFMVEKGFSEDSGIEADDRYPILNAAVENANYAREMGNYAAEQANAISDKANLKGDNHFDGKQIFEMGTMPDSAANADIPVIRINKNYVNDGNDVIQAWYTHTGEVLRLCADGSLRMANGKRYAISDEWRLIREMTLTEDAVVSFTTDINNKALNLKKVQILIECPKREEATQAWLNFNGTLAVYCASLAASASSPSFFIKGEFESFRSDWRFYTISSTAGITTAANVQSPPRGHRYSGVIAGTMRNIALGLSSNMGTGFPVGTKITVWGVDAE